MSELVLMPPNEFQAFPYKPPYSIQVELMTHIYQSIENGKVTIVESPTGTGKTLSLLCSSLTWLRDEKDRAMKGKVAALSNGETDELEWVEKQTAERLRRELEADEVEYSERLAAARKKEAVMKKMAKARVTKKPKLYHPTNSGQYKDEDDAAFLPDDSNDDEDSHDNLSPAVRALMEKIDRGKPHAARIGEPDPTCTKIYYASRTHSQLAQILPELEKLKFEVNISRRAVINLHSATPSNLSRKRSDMSDEYEEENPEWRTVSLGSRKQLCINDELRARPGDLDEKCRELLGDHRCQYLPPIDEDFRMTDFRDQILASPKDIEDLAAAGRLAHICPYFGSRRAIPQAELVTLPYNLLLQKTAREALGINLTNQIVIVDEAHNLISTLLSLSTTRLPLHTLQTSLTQLALYFSKFRTRLTASHALHLKRLMTFLEALKSYAGEWLGTKMSDKSTKEKAEVMEVGELMQRLGRKVMSVNMLEIESYLRSSKIARKISGYSDKQAEKLAGQDPAKLAQLRRGVTPPLHTVEAFILAMAAANHDGRVSFSVISSKDKQGQVEIKYQLLNPSTPFREVVDTARSIVLAGGTMSPISDIVAQLFSHLPADRISEFSCGHVIPSSNLQTLVVTKGPRGGELEFKYDKRGDKSIIDELGQILLNFTNVVPAGMVVFFPSYSFLNVVKDEWTSNGTIVKLNAKKKLFLEPQEATEVESVLQEYAKACTETHVGTTKGGALLLAVIGAKLSEGLNFSDNLARAVVIIGLPYANLGSPELRERMSYVNRLQTMLATQTALSSKNAGIELYENMCMNAVNQSIGRAIRHQNDWASLILIDRRYGSAKIQSKLPKWIGKGVTVTETFGSTMKNMGQFFREKKALSIS